jgi:Ca2+/H+ antiporter, TMEM165/GDT1 family
MSEVIHSFLLLLATEMGDKTQLLAFLLASRFQKPLPILAGIFCATVLNHALAASLGLWVANTMGYEKMRWALIFLFLFFALWVLIPDKKDSEEGGRIKDGMGPFLTTLVAFFLAEMGDKTQIATIMLAARYQSILNVVVGTTAGMMVADGLAVYLGDKLAHKIPMHLVRLVASILFALFALAVFLKA